MQGPGPDNTGSKHGKQGGVKGWEEPHHLSGPNSSKARDRGRQREWHNLLVDRLQWLRGAGWIGRAKTTASFTTDTSMSAAGALSDEVSARGSAVPPQRRTGQLAVGPSSQVHRNLWNLFPECTQRAGGFCACLSSLMSSGSL